MNNLNLESQDQSRQKLFNYLHDQFNAIPLQSEMMEIETIVFESDIGKLYVLEQIQKYQLERGINDEFINDKILVMKGLK